MNYSRIMRLLLILSSICGLVYPAFANTSLNRGLTARHLDTVVAIVNDDVITERELQKRIGFYHLETQGSQQPLANHNIRMQILRSFIDQLLCLQIANRAGIEVTKLNVDQAIEHILQQNKLTKEKLMHLLAQQGLTWEDYRKMLEKELVMRELLQREVGSKIKISEQEIEKYLNSFAYGQNNITEYLISDILIGLPDIPSPQDIQHAHQNVELILKQLHEGKDFKQLAIQYSNGPDALQGGSMGWRRIEEIPTVFVEKIQTMKVGEWTGPIKASNGLHILKLDQVKGQKMHNMITETKVRHILKKVTVIDTEAAVKSSLEALCKRIQAGESFAELAKQHSQDPLSAIKGGSLGWVPPGVMVPQFEKVMQSQAIGKMSEPFRSEYGWHILLVEARRQKENTREYYINELRQKIYRRRYLEESQNFVRRLREISYVEVRPNI